MITYIIPIAISFTFFIGSHPNYKSNYTYMYINVILVIDLSNFIINSTRKFFTVNYYLILECKMSRLVQLLPCK